MAHFQGVARHGGCDYPIEGYCDPAFTKVRDRFIANFTEGTEVGATVAVNWHGRQAVDLWGGYRDKECRQPWQRDTIVNMMSVAKIASAACIHLLVDRGAIDVNEPVASYWPEFGRAGKEKLPLRFVLDHRAGLAAVTEALPRGSFYNWRLMADALARQAPLWPPGEQCGYHGLTQGFVLGEVIQRVTGRSLGTFFRQEFAEPLGLDYRIGMEPEAHGRCARFIPNDVFLQRTVRNPAPVGGYSWTLLYEDEDFNSADWRNSEIPSANGHGNARSVARFLAMLVAGGELEGKRIMSRAAVERMITEQHHLMQIMMPQQYHMGSGVILNSPPYVYMGPISRAFGHHGAGGAIGVGDPEAGIAFAYGMNLMHAGTDSGPRSGELIKSAYECLGS
jgi:CubicO group peptidase (beta-lactamase class C family)